MADTPSGDTTKVIPPPRRGPRYVDLALAAVAGSLATVLVIGVLFLGSQRVQVLPSASSSATPSASASSSASASFSPIQINTPTPVATPVPTPVPTQTPRNTAPPTKTP